MKIQKLSIGTWFQRTTLHLSEVWSLIDKEGKDTLFEKGDLSALRKSLQITKSTRVAEEFESVYFESEYGFSGVIHEDGLVVISCLNVENIEEDKLKLKSFYENVFSKAISYLFSKGAPVPKELANIPTVLPYMFVISDSSIEEVTANFFSSEERIHSIVRGQKSTILRGSRTMVVLNPTSEEQQNVIVETFIFFREFKAQLERYLQIHRILWEKIRVILEQEKIKGTSIEVFRSELQGYQKTVNLIEARINQMPTYVKTRQKLTVISDDTDLSPIASLRFEDLLNTHEYIKHLWSMTKNYLQSALDMLASLQAESTKTTISSLQLVTTIGVISGLIGYLGKDALPPVSSFGFLYLIGLLFVTWLINKIISLIYKHRSYKIKQSHKGIQF